MAAAAIPLRPIVGGMESDLDAAVVPDKGKRAEACLSYRIQTAREERTGSLAQPDNGDAERFTDFSGSYSKALLHDALGIPNKAAMQSLIKALETGEFSDFQNILVGTPGGGPNSKENGPQTALAFDLEGLDSHATTIAAAPSVASAQTAAEAVEHYWGALLRDVPFTEYPTNSLVAKAVADMNKLSFINAAGSQQFPAPVTPENLFRGQFVPGDGNVQGPYISQFLLQSTFFGAQLLNQQYQTLLPATAGGSDFMTSVSEFQTIQNGGDSGRKLSFDPTSRYIRAGRDLAAYTHVDALYQAYLVAALVLTGINTPPNPGNPYIGSKTEKGFGTLGGPDAVGTLTEMATRALKAAWYHKWMVDLRPRPEEYAGLVQANLTKATPMPEAAAALHGDVLNSAVLPLIQSIYGSYLLPQAFPEGSPTHPAYPTGHGTAAGACITVLKFFYDGSFVIPNPVQPSPDGLSVVPYTGPDAGQLTVNGELNKLGHNVSFGHGIHAGIHWRSDSDTSLLLGEALALEFLANRARTYNEPFTVKLTKFDGTTVTISNA